MSDTELKLLKSFPGSFINGNGELIAHEKSNTYLILVGKSDLELKFTVLEWLSWAASCAIPYKSKQHNQSFHNMMLNGINDFLDTDFSPEDIELIYTKLGNNCNRPLCEKFVASGYDMEVLR